MREETSHRSQFTMSGNDDPFACFDDDVSDTADSGVVPPTLPRDPSLQAAIRDPDCGVLAFHAGTEQALLTHVQNKLISKEQQTPEAVLQAVDDFCIERHWMMHCGPEKAIILKDFLKQCVGAADKNHTRKVVELGTYCGYSSIMLCKALLQMNEVSSFHIYSVEVNPQHARVAKRLVQLAKLDQYITVLLLDTEGTESGLASLLQTKLVDDKIDFLFLDHDKDAYLADLQRLEQARLIQTGTYVAADNVIFAQIDNYRTYMKLLASQGVVETRLVESRLEYSEPDANASNEAKLCDGIGECG